MRCLELVRTDPEQTLRRLSGSLDNFPKPASAKLFPNLRPTGYVRTILTLSQNGYRCPPWAASFHARPNPAEKPP